MLPSRPLGIDSRARAERAYYMFRKVCFVPLAVLLLLAVLSDQKPHHDPSAVNPVLKAVLEQVGPTPPNIQPPRPFVITMTDSKSDSVVTSSMIQSDIVGPIFI
jgi:hypothetical protein